MNGNRAYYSENYQSLRIAAEDELRDEEEREEIERIKAGLRESKAAGKWWHRYFPFTITIERR